MNTCGKIFQVGMVLAFTAMLLVPSSVVAHCDGMDGPVINAARKALSNEDVNLVLIWIQKEDEPEIRQAFNRTLQVRRLSAEAQELADRYFFETLVRIHRAGEGAPYTGLKPAGRDLGPAIPLADVALSEGNVENLVTLITHEMRNGITERFNHALMAHEYSPEDVEAGREYVLEYVTFIHYIERAYEATTQPVGGHYPENQHAEERDNQ